jgi:CRISPR-associated protein Csy3
MAEKVSVLAFEKKFVPSDGRMYGTLWENRESVTPLKLQAKSVRGTVSHRLKKTTDKDIAKLNMDVADPNPQTIDSCSLSGKQDTLKLHFTLKVLGGVEYPSACNNAAFTKTYKAAAKDYIDRQGFRELARRYATNIANARFLWRNRVGAENIEVQVDAINKGSEQSWVFDATKFNTRNFDVDNEQVRTLAQRIATALSSENDFLILEINCFAKIGKAQEVYPSEELVLDKSNSKSKKSKVLYSVDGIDGIAAMHSQKIGNALRTIDTWYPEVDDPEASVGPIAIEPYGAVTNLGKAFRSPKDKQDFYTFFDKFAWREKLERIEDEHYVMAVLVRGGVFGESDK